MSIKVKVLAFILWVIVVLTVVIIAQDVSKNTTLPGEEIVVPQ